MQRRAKKTARVADSAKFEGGTSRLASLVANTPSLEIEGQANGTSR